MNVKKAKQIATEWISQVSTELPTFHSAYLAGSIVYREDHSKLPKSSDLDVLIILNQADIPMKPGKIVYQGVLLDVTYLPWAQFQNSERILGSYHLANSLKSKMILSDPTGELQKIQAKVADLFPKRMWVEARCEDALERITNNLDSHSNKTQWADQVMAWLFAAGVMTHVLLVADLQNPTVRLRYLNVKKLLRTYDLDHVYEELLDFLGCRELSSDRISSHLNQLETTFDAAVSIAKTPLFFSSDITKEARSIAIDGSCELIKAGSHREAVFWMVATYARCHQIFALDAPKLLHMPGFNSLLADLGITSTDDLDKRVAEIREYLPNLKKYAEAIMSQNSGSG